MKIGYVSPVDPFTNRNAWSGTYFSTRAALEEAGNEVEWIKYSETEILVKIVRKLYKIIFGRQGSFTHSRLSSWVKTRKLKITENYDVIFIPGQVDIVAGLKTDKPIIYYTDGTVPLMVDYYWFGFSKRAVKEAIRLEQKAADNTTISLYSSDWARNSAIKEYGILPEESYVLPFGANLTTSDLTSKGVKNSKNNKINMLFTGVDWKRKGGNIAVATAKKLKEDGYDVVLSIVGIKELDRDIESLDYVENIGFLNKQDKSQYDRYLELWRNTDIMILPTRAECSATVYSEAAAFGVPVISTDTGGVSNYVLNDINGRRLPLSSSGEEYAKVIEEWLEEKKLPVLSEGAKKLYEERNSWTAWGKKFNQILDNLIKKIP